jgi:hypothetical protein
MINSRDIPARPQVLASGGTGLLFRLGLGGLFLINAVVAVLHPGEFVGLINDSGLANVIGHIGGVRLVTVFVAVNDAALACLLFSGKCRRLTNLWIGLYLLVVTAIKVLALA